MTELHELTAIEAATLIASRKLSSVELTRACLDRAEARDSAIGAWAHLDRDYALAQAAVADRQAARSPLHGVPFGVKDVIDTEDMPTELGSPAHKGRRPTRDAIAVARMRARGAVLMGKLVTTEYAMFSPNGTRHPLDPERTPGGSSSGTAAAVADCQVPIGFGTQTAGSLIRPAAFCGVFGLKPTHGVVPLDGVQPLTPFLDTIGYMARSIEDLQAFFALAAQSQGQDRGDRRPLRVGLYRPPGWDRAQPETKFVVEAVADQLTSSGVEVDEVILPFPFTDLLPVHRTILCCSIVEALAPYYAAGPTSESLAAILSEGRATDPELHAQHKAIAEQCRAGFSAEIEGYDALLCPSTLGEAPIGSATGDPVFQVMWTLLGVPCVNLPLGRGPNGLPVGVQLVGHRHADHALLGVAKCILERVKLVDLTVGAGGAASSGEEGSRAESRSNNE